MNTYRALPPNAGGKLAESMCKVAKNDGKVAKNSDEVAKNSDETAKNGTNVAQIDENVAKNTILNMDEVEKILMDKGVQRDVRRNMLAILTELSKDCTLTIDSLMMLTSLSFGGVRNALSALKAHNLIRREGGDRGGYWEVIHD